MPAILLTTWRLFVICLAMAIRRLTRSAASPPPAPGSFHFVAGPHGPRVQDPNGNVLRIRPEPGTPSNGEAASAVIGEGDAAILATAKTAGVAGDSLSAEVVIVSDSVALTVVESAGKTTVTSGDKRRMVVTADFGDGDETVVLIYAGNTFGEIWTSNGLEAVLLSGTQFRGSTYPNNVGIQIDIVIRVDGSAPIASFRVGNSGQDFLDDVDWSAADASGLATGTPTVTAAPATAAQAIALSQAALPVALAAGSDGSASLAAVAETSLAGGTPPTEGQPGDQLYDTHNIYTRAATGWETAPFNA